jgi:hypothetical protein
LEENEDATAYDSSFYENDGVLPNGGTWTGESLELDGVHQYVDCGASSSLELGTSDMTIVAQIKLKPSGEDQGLVTKGGSSKDDAGYAYVYRHDLDEFALYLSDGASGKMVSSSGTNLNVADDIWHTVAVTVDIDGYITFYLDGSLAGPPQLMEFTGSSIQTPNRSLQVGSWEEGYFLNGRVRNVRVYKRILSFEEIDGM